MSLCSCSFFTALFECLIGTYHCQHAWMGAKAFSMYATTPVIKSSYTRADGLWYDRSAGVISRVIQGMVITQLQLIIRCLNMKNVRHAIPPEVPVRYSRQPNHRDTLYTDFGDMLFQGVQYLLHTKHKQNRSILLYLYVALRYPFVKKKGEVIIQIES